MQLFCQSVALGFLALGFLMGVRDDFEGKKSEPPSGFKGFVGSCVGVAICAAVYYGAGGLSLIFGQP